MRKQTLAEKAHSLSKKGILLGFDINVNPSRKLLNGNYFIIRNYKSKLNDLINNDNN